MKPRTKHECHAVELSNQLPALTSTQEKYAYEHCFDHLAVLRKGMYHCTDCGHSWLAGPKQEIDLDKEFGTSCPHCGHRMKVHTTRKQHWFVRSSYQVVTAIDDCQVIRTFYNRKYYTVGSPAHYWMNEAVRIMMFPDRKDDIIIARPAVYNGMYCDSYSFDKELSIKCTIGKMNWSSYYYNPSQYLVTADVVYPHRRVLPILKRNGYNGEVYDFPTYKMIDALLRDSRIETIVKAHRTDILRGLDAGEVRDLWPQVKMLIRHNYRPSDYTTWKDTVDLASQLHLDTHSPKYVLPADLHQLHDRLARKQCEAEERKAAVEAKRENEQFIKEHGMLLAVVIKEHGMTFRPLQNKLEFLEEGKAMNHCVASYFGKKSCLILSVRSTDNNHRIATVELNTKNFNVVQCRAACNAKPERYDEILSIINAHRMDLIRAAKTIK